MFFSFFCILETDGAAIDNTHRLGGDMNLQPGRYISQSKLTKLAERSTHQISNDFTDSVSYGFIYTYIKI